MNDKEIIAKLLDLLELAEEALREHRDESTLPEIDAGWEILRPHLSDYGR